MRPTVHDIAEKAGVSLATVDRVLNNRPGVKAKTRALVEDTIAQIGYVRDVAAANLARKRLYHFEFLIPDSDNSFLDQLRGAVREVAALSRVERIEIGMREVAAFDPAALVAAMREAIAGEPDGIAMVAIDDDAVRAVVAEAKQAGVAVVTVVSDLPGSARVHYAGIDNLAAGRTAASLIGRFIGGTGTVGVIAGSLNARDHRERLAGFEEALKRDFPGVSVLPVIEGRDNPKRVEREATALLDAQPALSGLYSLGAGNRGLVKALRGRNPARHMPVIAHELTATTRAALSEGLFDAVLNQDAGHEVRSAVRVMKAQADGLHTVDAQERIRIDIFLKDNMPQ
ncbi:LacI family DNA-binding transcriptional regulator [Rhizobium sp. C4]|uniref:LacI family DNA-binding transcriptional regulator n=1 Tax=Rhizobium sp. C4 TaxID=1349800 RepID=UPI001E344E56|nr:LacI family DNA-binding transcriptional regulator [Rhizobium sp. C4]MCD2175873.1 LacI family DNA-binding transcriptional regulator [Rhizobium sp. C4]